MLHERLDGRAIQFSSCFAHILQRFILRIRRLASQEDRILRDWWLHALNRQPVSMPSDATTDADPWAVIKNGFEVNFLVFCNIKRHTRWRRN